MPGLVARLALRLRLPAWLVIAGLSSLAIGAALLAWNLWLSDHDDGVISNHENGIGAQLHRQGRAADQNMAGRAADDLTNQAQAREEFNNATAHLPRTGLTDRQRIDLCDELRTAGTDQAVLASTGCVQAGAKARP